MVKVRGVYPSYIRLLFIAILAPLFHGFTLWIFESHLLAALFTVALISVLLSYTVIDMYPMKFIHNIVKQLRVPYKAEDVIEVISHTASNKWVYGVSVTTAEFVFSQGKIRLTDTRNPFAPLQSGYCRREIEAILLWLSCIPESTPGYQHVEHLQYMLTAKNADE